MMKSLNSRTGRLLFLAFGLYALTLNAQSELSKIQLTQEALNKREREIIAEHLQLSKQSMNRFWRIYAEYETARNKLAIVRIRLLSEYTQKHASLDESSTDDLCRMWLKNDIAYAKLKRKYYRQFCKATSRSEASQFFRLENRIDLAIDSQFKDAMLQGDGNNNNQPSYSEENILTKG